MNAQSHRKSPAGAASPEGSVCVRACSLGRGLFATRDFKPGDFIYQFTGTLMSHAALLARGDDQNFAVQVETDSYLLPDEPGRYTNHSCEPNAGLRGDTRLIALQAIARSEEIRFDYSTCMSEELWTMSCACGTPSCRHLIQDFHYLPPALRKSYLTRGIVQRFIVDEILQLAGAATEGLAHHAGLITTRSEPRPAKRGEFARAG